jgi:hypothetical protein
LRGDNQVLLNYHGLDGKLRRTTLTFDPPPDRLTTGNAPSTICISLRAKCGRSFLAVSCDQANSRPLPFLRGLIAARREMRERRATAPASKRRTSAFNEILCRSAADLAMLMTDTPQGRYPYAGIPWFSTTFGRDGLITALQMLWWSPGSGARRVAPARRLSGQDHRSARRCRAGKNSSRDARRRDGGAARSAVRPLLRQRRFHAAVRLLAGLYAERTGDIETIASCGRRSRRPWPGSTVRAIRTATASSNTSAPAIRVSPIRAGRIRTTRFSMPTGGWPRARSRWPRCKATSTPPSAWRRDARGGSDATPRAESSTPKRRLAERFEAAFWCPEIETYALALDGAKSPAGCARRMPGRCCSPASPPRPGRARRQGTAAADFLLRLGHPHGGDGEARFNPMSYHNGSVWPHDNALIALGFARYGLQAIGRDAVRPACSAPATYMDHRRLPELFCGFQRQRGHGPTLYPVACSPQAWASATPFTLLEASLGLEFDPFEGEIRLAQSAPAGVSRRSDAAQPAARSSSVDLRVRRHGDTVSLDTPRINGGIRVSIVFSS